MTKCVNAETVDAASVAREVLNWLEKQSSWLLILDNVNDISVALPDLKCVNNVPRMCGERALCRECVENVYLHDNRIFLFFLQLHCQFHPFLALSEPGNVPGLDSMGNNHEFEEIVNWLEERAHCGS